MRILYVLRKSCKASVVILTGKRLYLMLIYMSVDWSTPRSVLSRVVLRLCCATQLLWLQDKLSDLTVAEEPARNLPLDTSDYAICTALP